MIYGSVCSGIEAATVAWHPLGWTPAFFSEIEDFPKRVLAHHYPTVPDLGDFTQIGADRGPVDLLVGGTPCQSFSVAGLRKGMADARGNLALEFLRLAARLDARWILWENVPGVLSSNGGRDFGSFLGGLAELGYGFAYRVLDAQYVGTCELHGGRGRSAVPQRRRRVFVVGHAGGLWQRAAAVLFERACLRGDPAPRRASRADVAGSLGGGSGARGWCDDLDRSGAFIPTAQPYSICPGDCRTADGQEDIYVNEAEVSRTLDCGGADPTRKQGGTMIAFHVTQDPISSDGATPALGCGNKQGCGTLGVLSFSAKDHGADAGELAPTLRAGGHTSSHANGGVMPAVMSGMAVRRLTPRECERLQGFPDDYTAIQGAKDGPRYRALGNSMAVPVMRWIGQRIALVDAAVRSQQEAA